MTIRYSIAIIVFFHAYLLQASAIHPALQRTPLVSVQDIESWIKDPKQPIKSVSELLAKLPEAYRSYYVLQYFSRSLHDAKTTSPRIIFYGPDARLLIGISTTPYDGRGDVVELMEYDPAMASFRAHELDFENEPELRRDPPSCHGCHRGDIRPNWAPYDAWPGTFGTVHDTIHKNSEEAVWYADVRRRATDDERLKFLPGFGKADAVSTETTFSLNHSIAANGGLSTLLGFINRERIANRILTSAKHDMYRNAITAALIECEGDITDYLPPELLTNHTKSYANVLFDTDRAMKREAKRRISLSAQHLKVASSVVDEAMDHHGLREAEIRRTAQLRFLLENRREGAVEMEEWATTIERGTYAFNDGSSGLENLIGHYARQAYAHQPDFLAKLPFEPTPFAISTYKGNVGEIGAEPFALELYPLKGSNKAICQQLILTDRSASHN